MKTITFDEKQTVALPRSLSVQECEQVDALLRTSANPGPHAYELVYAAIVATLSGRAKVTEHQGAPVARILGGGISGTTLEFFNMDAIKPGTLLFDHADQVVHSAQISGSIGEMLGKIFGAPGAGVQVHEIKLGGGCDSACSNSLDEIAGILGMEPGKRDLDALMKHIRNLVGKDKAHNETINERDKYCDMAESLADAIAAFFGIDLGEHSNVNDPWANALAYIAGETGKKGEPDHQAVALHKIAGLVALSSGASMTEDLPARVQWLVNEWEKAVFEREELRAKYIESERSQPDNTPTMENVYFLKMNGEADWTEIDRARFVNLAHLAGMTPDGIIMCGCEGYMLKVERRKVESKPSPDEIALLGKQVEYWKSENGKHVAMLEKIIAARDALKLATAGGPASLSGGHAQYTAILRAQVDLGAALDSIDAF